MNARQLALWLLLLAGAAFAGQGRAQSTDSCTESPVGSGDWYKYGQTGLPNFSNNGQWIYANSSAVCAALEAELCGEGDPGAADACTRPGWTPAGSTASNTARCRDGGSFNVSAPGTLSRMLQSNPAVDCPADVPDECTPIPGQPGTKFTAGDWRDIAAAPSDFCDESTNCKITVNQGVDIGGVTVWTMTHTDQTCSAGAEEGPDELDQEDGESCTPVGDGEYCASPSGEGDCGYLNDKFVCFNTVPDEGCKYMSDGSGVCDSEASSPPKPDDGTPGTPATPDDEITTTPPAAGGGGGCGAGCDYYDPETVDGSARDPTDTGNGTGGGTNVGGVGGTGDDDDEDLGELEAPELGEVECDYEGCAQDFYNRVLAAPIVASVASVGSSIPAGTCPTYTLEAFGEEYSLSQPMCDIWDTLAAPLSAIFLVLWAWVATRIVLSA